MEERYEIRGKIGQGGLGAVYRAYDTRMNREVAIKRILTSVDDHTLSKEATRQLLKEAGSLASLQHPNIVTIYDVGSDDDGPFVVMELLTGDTLEGLIGKGSFTWQDFRQLAMQTLEALIAAQELHLVHRDLKPSNIMLTWLPSGKFQVKIVDFGLAKLSSKPSLQTIDQSDGVFGSIYFMAPEQFERVPIDLKSDLYAIGCVFYYGLTGTYPFDGDTAVEVMASHLRHHVTPLHEVREGIPTWACDWVMWHINRYPTDRPASAREALQYFVENDAYPSPPLSTGMPAPVADEPKRMRLVIPGAPVPVVATETLPTQSVKTAAAPVALTPPIGSKPSVHTTAQIIHASTQIQEIAPAPEVEEIATPPATAEEVIATPPPPVIAKSPPKPILAKVEAVTKSAPTVRKVSGSGTAPLLKPNGAATSPVVPAKPIKTAVPQQSSDRFLERTMPTSVATTPSTASEAPAIIDPVAEPDIAPKKKSIPPAIKVVIAVVLGLLIVGFSVFAFNKIRDNDEAKQYNEMIKITAKDDATELPVTKSRLEILLRNASMVSANTNREVIYKALFLAKSNDGTDVDARIAEFATTKVIVPDVRIALLNQVLKKRKNPATIGTLLNFARTTDDKTAAVAAIEATRFMATDTQFQQFMDIIKTTKDEMIRKAAEESAGEIIKKTASKAALGKSVLEAYDAATVDALRYSYLRLLGRVGGEASLALAKKRLSSNEVKDKIAALLALGTWADDAGFKELIAFLGTNPDLTLRRRAYESAYDYATQKEGNIEEVWTLLSTESKTQEEQTKIVHGLANVKPDPWAFALLDKIAKTTEFDKVIDLAERAILRLKDTQKNQTGTKNK